VSNHLLGGCIAVALVIGPTVAAAAKCDADKLKATAKLEAASLTCVAKAAKGGDPAAVPACLDKATAKFVAGFAKAGACAGDRAVCETTATDCRETVAAAITAPPPSKCAAAKLTAAAKLSQAALGCFTTAAKRDLAVDADCVAKATAKFDAAIAKAGPCPDGGDPATLVTNACIAPAVALAGEVVTSACPAPPPAVCAEDGDPTACEAWSDWGSACHACCEGKSCGVVCSDAWLYSCTLIQDSCALTVNEDGCAEECCGS